MNVHLLLDSPSDERRRNANSLSNDLDIRSRTQQRGGGGGTVGPGQPDTNIYRYAMQSPIPSSPMPTRPMPSIPAPYSSDPSPMYPPPPPPAGPTRVSTSGSSTPTHVQATAIPPPHPPHSHAQSQAQSPAMTSLRSLDPGPPHTPSSTPGISHYHPQSSTTAVGMGGGHPATSASSPHHAFQQPSSSASSSHPTPRGYTADHSSFPTHPSVMSVGMLKGAPHSQPIMDSSPQLWDRDRERGERDWVDRRRPPDSGRSRSRHGSFTDAAPLGSFKPPGMVPLGPPPPSHSPSQPSHPQQTPPSTTTSLSRPLHPLDAHPLPPHTSRSRRGSLSQITNPLHHPGRVNTAPPQGVVAPGIPLPGPSRTPPMASMQQSGPGRAPLLPPSPSKNGDEALGRRDILDEPLGPASMRERDRDYRERDRERVYRDQDMRERDREREFREREREMREKREMRDREYRGRELRDQEMREWDRERERELRERAREQRDREDMETIRAAASSRKQQQAQPGAQQQAEMFVLKPNPVDRDREIRDRERARERERYPDRQRAREMAERQQKERNTIIDRERERDLLDKERGREYHPPHPPPPLSHSSSSHGQGHPHHLQQPPTHPHHPHQPPSPSHEHPHKHPHHHSHHVGPSGILSHLPHGHAYSHTHIHPHQQSQGLSSSQQSQQQPRPPHQGSPSHRQQIGSPYGAQQQQQQQQRSPPLPGHSPPSGHHTGYASPPHFPVEHYNQRHGAFSPPIGPGIHPPGISSSSSHPPSHVLSAHSSNHPGPIQLNPNGIPPPPGAGTLPPSQLLTGPGGVGPNISGPGIPPGGSISLLPGPSQPSMVGPGVGYGHHAHTPPILGGPGIGVALPTRGTPSSGIEAGMTGPGAPPSGNGAGQPPNHHHHHIHHIHHPQHSVPGSGGGRDGVNGAGREVLIDARDGRDRDPPGGKSSRVPEREIVIIGTNKERVDREKEFVGRDRDRVIDGERERDVAERRNGMNIGSMLGKDMGSSAGGRPLSSGARDGISGIPPQRQFQSQFHTVFVTSGPGNGSRISSPAPLESGKKNDREMMTREMDRMGAERERERENARTGKGRMGDSGDVEREKRPGGGDSRMTAANSARANVRTGASSFPGPTTRSTTSDPAAPPDASRQVMDGGMRKSASEIALTGPPQEAFKGTGMMGGEEGIPLNWQDAPGLNFPPPRMLNRGYSDYGMEYAYEGLGMYGRLGAGVGVTAPPVWPERQMKARTLINLGTFVYPKTPFPYLFDEFGDVLSSIRVEKGEKVAGLASDKEPTVEDRPTSDGDGKQTETPTVDDRSEKATVEANDILDYDLRTTIIVPHGYLPLGRPTQPKIWGGGVLLGGTRRIYTDDSDLFLCALHSGWITWSDAVRARKEGRDLRVEVRILKCVNAGGGLGDAVVVGDGLSSRAKQIGKKTPVNGSVLREEVVGRFVGGPGAAFRDLAKDDRRKRRKSGDHSLDGDVNDAATNDTIDADDQPDDDEAQNDDGRSLESAGWGSGHDGSAIEIIKAELTTKSTGRLAPGLGMRNRAQRLLEYAERRQAILGLGQPPCTGGPSCLLGRKRRRSWEWEDSGSRRLPNASMLDTLPEQDESPEDVVMKPAGSEMASNEEASHDSECTEQTEMKYRTVLVSFPDGKHILAGFTYDPIGLHRILFPKVDTVLPSRPRKRRRIGDDTGDVREASPMDVDDAEVSKVQSLSVYLETQSELYLLSMSPSSSDEPNDPKVRKYNLFLVKTFLNSHPAQSIGMATPAKRKGSPLPEPISAPSDPASSPLPAISPSSRASSSLPEAKADVTPMERHASLGSASVTVTDSLSEYVASKLPLQDSAQKPPILLYRELSQDSLQFTDDAVTVLDSETSHELLKLSIQRWKCGVA